MSGGGAGGPTLAGEAAIVAMLAPLTARFPGAFALTDDCAVLAPEPGTEIVLKTDAVAEGVHFLAHDAPADIGWKALAVNVSDLVAKGARPRVYLMSLSFPEAPEQDWLAAFAAGLAEAQQRFGIVLAGGDTDRRPGPTTVTITAVGEVPAGRMVRRGAAQPGDRLYVSGTLGDAALGLMLAKDAGLAATWRLAADEARALIGRYRRPEPRLELGAVLLAEARAAMDLSDGLAKDLGRMAAASGCGADVERARLPLSAAARRVVAGAPEWFERAALAGGDDYEVLAAVAPERCAAFEAASARAGVVVTAIGAMTAHGGVRVTDDAGRSIALSHLGFDHF